MMISCSRESINTISLQQPQRGSRERATKDEINREREWSVEDDAPRRLTWKSISRSRSEYLTSKAEHTYR